MEQLADMEQILKNRFIIDVRSPIEFNHGHIPHARNLSLFSDDERKIVGTVYKKLGQRPAIEKGLELLSLQRILQEIRNLDLPHAVVLYCARGGMRSASMAWLLQLLGYKVLTINGGYKCFRKWVRNQFLRFYNLLILGGETGSGKTKLLGQLETNGETVLDLEGLAHHRGSVFGHIEDQPTQEQFENDLALSLFIKRENIIWVEDESERIGSITIPHFFYQQMRSAQMIALQVPYELRLQECLNQYLPLGKKNLSIAIHRLRKKLGGLDTKKALEAIEQNNFKIACEILLRYYDKKYRYGMSLKNPENLRLIPMETPSIQERALKVKSFSL